MMMRDWVSGRFKDYLRYRQSRAESRRLIDDSRYAPRHLARLPEVKLPKTKIHGPGYIGPEEAKRVTEAMIKAMEEVRPRVKLALDSLGGLGVASMRAGDQGQAVMRSELGHFGTFGEWPPGIRKEEGLGAGLIGGQTRAASNTTRDTTKDFDERIWEISKKIGNLSREL